jgi:hypothetical protein
MKDEIPEVAQITGTVVTPKPAPAPPKANAMVRLGGGVLFQTVAEVWMVAEGLHRGGAGPKGSTVGTIAASILKGQSLGLDAVTSMSNVTVTNGRVGIMGDLALGLLRRTGLINPKLGGYWREEFIGESEERSCRISACRHDTGEEATRSFSVADARRAGLVNKKTEAASEYTPVWRGFLDRMLRYRALGFLTRDLFGDVLLGLYMTEELKSLDWFQGGERTEEANSVSVEVPAGDDPFFQAEPAARALQEGPQPPRPEAQAVPVESQDAGTVLEPPRGLPGDVAEVFKGFTDEIPSRSSKPSPKVESVRSADRPKAPKLNF